MCNVDILANSNRSKTKITFISVQCDWWHFIDFKRSFPRVITARTFPSNSNAIFWQSSKICITPNKWIAFASYFKMLYLFKNPVVFEKLNGECRGAIFGNTGNTRPPCTVRKKSN